MNKVIRISPNNSFKTLNTHKYNGTLNICEDLNGGQDDIFHVAVEQAASVLEAQQVVGLPTDTVYGIAGLAQNSESVSKLYRIKGRNCKKPIAICVADIPDIFLWCHVTVPESLLKELLPGPVTLVFERTLLLNPELNPQTNLVGVRIPDSAFIRSLASRCQQPLALTSANLSEQPSSLSIQEFQILWPNLDLIVDCGHLGAQGDTQGQGSTVVDLSRSDFFTIIRPGCAAKETRSTLLNCGLQEVISS